MGVALQNLKINIWNGTFDFSSNTDHELQLEMSSHKTQNCIVASSDNSFSGISLQDIIMAFHSFNIYNVIRHDLASRLQSFFHHRHLPSLWHFYKYFHDHFYDQLSMVPRLPEFKHITRFYFHPFTLEIAKCNYKFYCNSFFSRTFFLWNSLPTSIFNNLMHQSSLSVALSFSPQ